MSQLAREVSQGLHHQIVSEKKQRVERICWLLLAGFLCFCWWFDRSFLYAQYTKHLSEARAIPLQGRVAMRPVLQVDCEEYGRICRGRARIAKVGQQ